MVAGSFLASVPIDDSPECAADAATDDDVLVREWVRILDRWEPEILSLEKRGEVAKVQELFAGISRSAGAQVMLTTLEFGLSGAMPGAPKSEHGKKRLLRLLLGGRDERTLRRWRSGEQLVPVGALDYLSRMRLTELSPDQSELTIVLSLND